MVTNTIGAILSGPGIYRLDRIPEHNRGHIGFDWRNLDRLMRSRFKVVHCYNLPLARLPLATNVMWVAH